MRSRHLLLRLLLIGSTALPCLVARAQSPFPQSTQSLVLWNGALTPSDKYIALSVQAGLSATYQLLLPSTAPTAGQLLLVTGVSGTDYTTAWATAPTGSGTPTQVAYWNTATSLSGNNNLWWDSTNKRLGVGTSLPLHAMHVDGGNFLLDTASAGVSGQLRFMNPAGTFASVFSTGTQAATIAYTLPVSQGANGSALTNNGFGTLSWTTVSGSGWKLLGNSGTDPSTNFVGTIDAQDFVIKANSIERARVTTAGNVGVGTSSPSAVLHVITSDTAASTRSSVAILGHNSSGTPAAGFGTGENFQLESSTTNSQDAAQVAGVWSTATDASRGGALTFSTVQSGTLAEKVRIDSGGQVGIGTTSPTAQLDINGGFATRYTLLTLSSGTNNNVSLGSGAFFVITGPTSAFSITGIAGGVDGRRVRFINATGYNCTIGDSSPSSSAGNRIITTGANADVTFIGGSQLFELIYDARDSVWLLGNNGTPSVGAIGSIKYAQKTADQSIANSNTLTNDNDLKFSISDNSMWELFGEVQADNASNSIDMQHAFTVPSGATMKIYFTGWSKANGAHTAGNGLLTSSGTGQQVSIGSASSTLIFIRGIIQTTTSGGTIQYQWCQNVSNGSATIVRSGSYLKITRVL